MRIAAFVMIGLGCSPATTGGSGGAGGGSGGSGGSISQPQQGVATYYAADGTGACSFDPSPNDLMVAAMDMPQWNGSAPCGECVHVDGPQGSVTVRIVDLCPGCEMGHLDLSMEAFQMIAPLSQGRVPITWQVVPCNVSGNVAYRFKEGSSQWWTAIQVRNHRLPIAKLEWQSGGAWVDIPRTDYNYFVVQNGVGPNAFMVRTTAIDGQQLTDMLPSPSPGTVVPGSGQFH
jgi:expansin (peptidoglycan-binding protein)